MKKIWICSTQIQANKPGPIDYLVEGILPRGTCGDVFGPPDEGKSTILLSLAAAIAAGAGTWFGRKIALGKVIILGGEKSSIDTWSRDLERIKAPNMKDNLKILQDDTPLWHWNKQGFWLPTKDYADVVADIKKLKPKLVLIDTLARIANGQNVIDYAQQASLGLEIERLKKEVNTTVLTVSHTNQASAHEPLKKRLFWLSRSGGSGLPGVFRWVAGLSQVREDDFDKKVKNKLPFDFKQAHGRKVIAFAVSKHNEMPVPAWNPDKPMFFEITQDGELRSFWSNKQLTSILINKDEDDTGWTEMPDMVRVFSTRRKK